MERHQNIYLCTLNIFEENRFLHFFNSRFCLHNKLSFEEVHTLTQFFSPPLEFFKLKH